MGKQNIKKLFKVWHGILVFVIVFGIGAGVSLSISAQAANQTLPAAPVSSGVLRPIQDFSTSFSSGVDLGTSIPSGQPGSSTQPVPKFSGINAPWVINENGPVEVPDDARFYGLIDVKGGLINSGYVSSAKLTIVQDILPSAEIKQGETKAVASINFSATGGDATLNSITMTRSGTASPYDINYLAIYDSDNTKSPPTLTLVAAAASSGTIYKANFIAPFKIINGATKKLIIMADINASAAIGNDLSIRISSAAISAPDALVSGSFPMISDVYTIVSSTSAGAFNKQISLFGEFIPRANASAIGNFMPTANAFAIVETLPITPVFIYDDLFVKGNAGAEPGNLFVNGQIKTNNGINVVGTTTIMGNLLVEGGIGIGSQITGDVNFVGGEVNVGGKTTITGNLLVQGAGTGIIQAKAIQATVIDVATYLASPAVQAGIIGADKIGGIYKVTGTSSYSATTTIGLKLWPVSCGASDIILSCNGSAEVNSGTAYFDGSSISGSSTCTAKLRIRAAGTQILTTEAVCFNPDRDNSAKPAGTVDLSL